MLFNFKQARSLVDPLYTAMHMSTKGYVNHPARQASRHVITSSSKKAETIPVQAAKPQVKQPVTRDSLHNTHGTPAAAKPENASDVIPARSLIYFFGFASVLSYSATLHKMVEAAEFRFDDSHFVGDWQDAPDLYKFITTKPR